LALDRNLTNYKEGLTAIPAPTVTPEAQSTQPEPTLDTTVQITQ